MTTETDYRDAMVEMAGNEIERLRKIENAALRVASNATESIYNGKVYVDKSAMTALDAALEARA